MLNLAGSVVSKENPADVREQASSPTWLKVAEDETASQPRACRETGLNKLRNFLEVIIYLDNKPCAGPGVIAWFDGNSCPSGWNEYDTARGRVIVGANSTSNQDAGGETITPWSVKATGGEEMHRLTEAEMPSHSHWLPIDNNPGNVVWGVTALPSISFGEGC
jgi:hypothetical protein